MRTAGIVLCGGRSSRMGQPKAWLPFGDERMLARVVRTVDFAVREDIDVLAMQEIKCRPDQFPYAEFEEAGYTVEAHGLNQWNGVAIASRLPMTDIEYSFPGMPGFAKGHEGPDAPLEARALAATIDGVKVWSLYVPNGRALDDPHFVYKLD